MVGARPLRLPTHSVCCALPPLQPLLLHAAHPLSLRTACLPACQAHKIEDQLSGQVQELQATLAAVQKQQRTSGGGPEVRGGVLVAVAV